jgi:plastocyanin
MTAPKPQDGVITGKVILNGTPPKPETVDTSKQPECAKVRTKPMTTEKVVTGAGNTLENVVVYISGGDPPETNAGDEPPARFDQQGCRYTTHVLAFRVGQEVSISNSDPFNHNIHPLAKINREWNKIQLPGTPPFSYSYDKEEFIPVKCNIHSWMNAYFAVLKTSHYAVTGNDGKFALPSLPPGTYTITAWHETYGTQSREVTVSAGHPATVNFTFNAKP